MATGKSATPAPPAGYPQGERKLSTGSDNKMKTVAPVDKTNFNEGAEDKEKAVFFGGYCKPNVDAGRPRPFLRPSPGPVPAPYNKLGYGCYNYEAAPVPAPAPHLCRPRQNVYDDGCTYDMDDYAANDNHRPMMTNMPRRPPTAERVPYFQDHRIRYGYACDNSEYHCLYRDDADDDNNNNANAFAETVEVSDFDPEARNEYYHYDMDDSSSVYQQQHRYWRQGQLQFQPQPQPHKRMPPRNFNMEKDRDNMRRMPSMRSQPQPFVPSFPAPPPPQFWSGDYIPTF